MCRAREHAGGEGMEEGGAADTQGLRQKRGQAALTVAHHWMALCPCKNTTCGGAFSRVSNNNCESFSAVGTHISHAPPSPAILISEVMSKNEET